jgi:hypothetical protein
MAQLEVNSFFPVSIAGSAAAVVTCPLLAAGALSVVVAAGALSAGVVPVSEVISCLLSLGVHAVNTLVQVSKNANVTPRSE